MDFIKTIINYLPYEVILLHYLKKTYNNDIRDFMLNSNNYSFFIGYIAKIINLYNDNSFHFFRIDNELYINHNLYYYNINDDNEINPEIYDIINDISIDNFENIFKNVFSNIPDIIIIQEEYADIKETNLIKNFIYDNEKIFNIKNYIKDDNFLNLSNYNLDTIFLKDCIYFFHNNKKFIYKNNKIDNFEWNIDNIDKKSILMSIYILIT